MAAAVAVPPPEAGSGFKNHEAGSGFKNHEAGSGFKDHFSGHAAAYAEGRPTYPPALVDALADLCPETRLAADCGCGSGQFSRLLRHRFAHVVAMDASPQQIAHAAPHPGVTYRVAPAEQTGLEPASVDLLTAAQAAHWFDLPAFWREAGRIVRPGGVVALITYNLLRIHPALDAVLDVFHHQTLDPWWPPERHMVMEGYAGLDFPFQNLPFPPLTMSLEWNLPALLRYFGTWSAVQAAERATGVSPLPALAQQIAPLWGDPEIRRLISWPLAGRIGRVEASPAATAGSV